MEVYVAVLDYQKDRVDALSFKKGDKFRIASKQDLKWWYVHSVEAEDHGYIPSKFLEVRALAHYVPKLKGCSLMSKEMILKYNLNI